MGGRGPKSLSTRARARRAKEMLKQKIAEQAARIRQLEAERDEINRKLRQGGFHYEQGA